MYRLLKTIENVVPGRGLELEEFLEEIQPVVKMGQSFTRQFTRQLTPAETRSFAGSAAGNNSSSSAVRRSSSEYVFAGLASRRTVTVNWSGA